MGKLRIYFKPIWYNIMHHKAYAGFCVFGTMLTFVFITILLQVTNVIMGNSATNVAAERIVSLPIVLKNESGLPVKGLNRSDIRTLMNNAKGYECYTCYQFQSTSVKVNGRNYDYGVLFIDKVYWDVFQFEFIQGHPFTDGEMQVPCMVVSERWAKKFFRDGKAIGREIQFQGETYKVTGVVADVSAFAEGGAVSLWVPEKFNKYIPTGNDYVSSYVLYPENTSVDAMMKSITGAFQLYGKAYYNIEQSTSMKEICTVEEAMLRKYGGDLLLTGVGAILVILLLIPILNIILLSMANTSLRNCEIGLQRALGATQKEAFLFVLMENLLLVVLGTLGGILLTFPICRWIDKWVSLNSAIGEVTLLPELDWTLLLVSVLPLMLLFSLLSGGIPAWLAIKHSIMEMLKGGAK